MILTELANGTEELINDDRARLDKSAPLIGRAELIRHLVWLKLMKISHLPVNLISSTCDLVLAIGTVVMV